MRFRFLRNFRLQLPRRWRDGMRRFWSNVAWYVGYPVYQFGAFFSWLGQLFSSWWHQRLLRYLIQGMPALFAFAGLTALFVLILTQDRAAMASQYQIQSQSSFQAAVTFLKDEKKEVRDRTFRDAE